MTKVLFGLAFLSLPSMGFAGTLENESGGALDIKIKCTSTVSRSIQSSTTITVKDGCTVTIKANGDSEEISGTCKIDKDKKIDC